MSIVLKNRMLGYYYLNASKADKFITLYFQISGTEAYKKNIIFPKCSISYVFLFENPDDDNKIYVSVRAMNTLADAMDQPFFFDREPLQVIAIGDQEKKSINFASIDQTDQTIDDPYFEPNCVPTEAENKAEAIVRQAVIDGNASTRYTYWIVDDVGTSDADIDPSSDAAMTPFSGGPTITALAFSAVVVSLSSDFVIVEDISLSTYAQ